jgi:hypothetical protein
LLLCGLSLPALGDAWLDAGDRGLRNDVELLAAYGVIDGVITTWPIPEAQLRQGLSDLGRLYRQPGYVQEAAQRVLDRLDHAAQPAGLRPLAQQRLTNSADGIRDFGSEARNQVDVAGGLAWRGDVASARLLAGVQTGVDGRQAQPSLDGSRYLVNIDNWLAYAGWVDQWYGPGWTSSLILSNNARPLPKIGLLRRNPHAFETPWLSWLGPWQLNFFIGLLDGPRIDRDTALGSLRLSFSPLQGLEIALTRATEFCGEHHPCNPLSAAVHVDNTPSSQNQTNDEATFELRYSRPFGSIVVSPYLQLMNEDDGPFTHALTSYLAGTSVAGPWQSSGARWRITAEMADSLATVNWFDFGKVHPGAAYNNFSYLDGFRYRDRTLGFSLDSDSRLFSLAAQLTDLRGIDYRLVYYRALINTPQLAAFSVGDPTFRNVVSAEPVRFNQAQAGLTVPLRGLRLSLDLRAQDRQPYPQGGGLFAIEGGVLFGF